jgi:WXG100 family type VII secretion target
MFAVDLDELIRSIDELGRCGGALDVRLEEVSRAIAHLHLTWAGAAATAQASAQAQWESGFQEMRRALAGMRAAADVAHRNYSEAVAANVGMWEQLR